MARVRVQTPSSALRTKSVSPKFDDSPSRQLMLDLERALGQAQIHETELQKVHIHDRRLFQENLDRVDTKKAREDVAALDAATSKHEIVRKEAEAELQRYYRELEEQERLKRKEEERRAQEQQTRAKAEAERKAKEEAERKARMEREHAAARKAAEEVSQAEEAERQNREEALAREKAEKERRQREEQEAAKASQQAAEENFVREKAARETAAKTNAGPDQTIQPQVQSSTTRNAEIGTQHQRFLQIHQNLKIFRKDFWAQCKKDVNLKSKVGDMRRAIKTSVGQLTEAKGANRQPVRNSLRELTLTPNLTIATDRTNQVHTEGRVDDIKSTCRYTGLFC
jgi:membrane protein involved in colicin uptake